MDTKKLIKNYLIAVNKLYGTPLKAFLNFVMVAGFYLIYDIAIVSMGSVAVNIYHIPVSQLHLVIFNSIIFPIVSYVIALQLISIMLGFIFWLGGQRKNK